MSLIPDIVANQAEFVSWRRTLHQNPGLGFEETFASDLVAKKLRAFGLDEVHVGVGKTGVVGVLRGKRASNRAIGIRADMDALPIDEENTFAHRSKVPGVMHACGHDGHTTILLASAWHLARTRDFAGTIHFIFQPAEEGLGGAMAMIEDNLFERFACDRVYACHNMPNMETGHMYIRPGTFMAGSSFFDIRVCGTGGHAALPQTTVDPALIVSNIVQASQSIVARNLSPMEAGIVSFTDVYAGSNSYNVIPDTATMKGCVRFFEKAVGETLRARLSAICTSAAQMYGGSAEITFRDVFVPLVNDESSTELSIKAAQETVGADKVHADAKPITGSEDFAFMLEKAPGSYILVGAGKGANVHNPNYDFNDDIITAAASYFCCLACSELK